MTASWAPQHLAASSRSPVWPAAPLSQVTLRVRGCFMMAGRPFPFFLSCPPASRHEASVESEHSCSTAGRGRLFILWSEAAGQQNTKRWKRLVLDWGTDLETCYWADTTTETRGWEYLPGASPGLPIDIYWSYAATVKHLFCLLELWHECSQRSHMCHCCTVLPTKHFVDQLEAIHRRSSVY